MLALVLAFSISTPPLPREECDLIEINTWGSDSSTQTQLIAWNVEYHFDLKRYAHKARFYDVGPYDTAVVKRKNGKWVVRVTVNGTPAELAAPAFVRTRTSRDVEVEDRRRWGDTPPSLPSLKLIKH